MAVSAKAGMDRKTARKYVEAEKLPSEMKVPRTWRTREDPSEEDWPELARLLADAPGLQAKTLLDDLVERHPERYEESHLRTLQRRVRQWRATEGPDCEVMLSIARLFPRRPTRSWLDEWDGGSVGSRSRAFGAIERRASAVTRHQQGVARYSQTHR